MSQVRAMDEKYNKTAKAKRYDQKCVVCGRNFSDVLRDWQYMVGCPTNNPLHHQENARVSETKNTKAEDLTVSELKKPRKKRSKS